MSTKRQCSCILCHAVIVVNNIDKHFDSNTCKSNRNRSIPENLDCSFCKKSCHNLRSLKAHENKCPKNKNRNYRNGMTGKIPWNKGLDKSDHRVQKIAKSVSKSMKKLYNSGYRSPPQTQEYWTTEKRKENL